MEIDWIDPHAIYVYNMQLIINSVRMPSTNNLCLNNEY
jgi:hypothetical protein